MRIVVLIFGVRLELDFVKAGAVALIPSRGCCGLHEAEGGELGRMNYFLMELMRRGLLF